MYLSTNHKPTYIMSTQIAYVPKYQPQTYIHREYRFPFENKYFNRAVSLAIRRAVGERSMLAMATTNAKTSTAANTNAETERSFVALVVAQQLTNLSLVKSSPTPPLPPPSPNQQ